MPGPTNKRAFYGCLGVAKCGQQAFTKVVSGSLSLSRNFNNIFARGKKDPIATYGDMPSVEFNYTRYFSSFTPIVDEDGINNVVGYDLLLGSDNSAFTTGNLSSTRCTFALLNNVTYNFPIDSPVTVEKKYIGFSKTTGSATGLGAVTTDGKVYRRNTYVSGLPAGLGEQAIQNISISYTINRTPVGEFATRKPYAIYINFPIETVVTFEMITRQLDSYTINALDSACKNPSTYKQNIVISTCAGGITIPEAYLSSLNYSGGDANTSSNQTLSATFTSYKVPNSQKIKPVLIIPEEDPCGN